MEIIIPLLFLVAGLFIFVRLLAAVFHVAGGNPPEWLMFPMSTGQPRFLTLIFLLLAGYVVASLFFDLPYFDFFDGPEEAVQ
ncbi:hypothetical protein [Hyphococcus sp.]|uniref:hypothetical protein n=1 Tax=Hyphococcus sp. TaxID=2038636 RepID=UPI00208D5599|nr:MAG: hypothetical protein DHS20C04_09670 [Marinicaulis sp.]